MARKFKKKKKKNASANGEKNEIIIWNSFSMHFEDQSRKMNKNNNMGFMLFEEWNWIWDGGDDEVFLASASLKMGNQNASTLRRRVEMEEGKK